MSKKRHVDEHSSSWAAWQMDCPQACRGRFRRVLEDKCNGKECEVEGDKSGRGRTTDKKENGNREEERERRDRERVRERERERRVRQTAKQVGQANKP